MRWVETAVVLGALGALGYYAYRRTRATSSPVGDLGKPASPFTDAISGAAWLTSDPLAWIRSRIEEKEEELL